MENIENVEIYRNVLSSPVKADVKELRNMFEDIHFQNCCENVYADFSTLENMQNEVGALWEITEISVSATPKMGFTIFFYNGEISFWDKRRVWVFIPCYDEQNWYYSNDLELKISIDGKDTIIDITEYTKYIDC